ncbi:MAG: arylsulfotransferase family protein [Janthinobacterium lividum]
MRQHRDVSPDEHELLITPHGTASTVSRVRTKADLRPVKGPKDGLIMNGIFEEVDLATGQVLHRWESLDHVALTESHAGVPEDPTEAYDYFRINPVAPTPDGNVIISARHTRAVYEVELATGNVRRLDHGNRFAAGARPRGSPSPATTARCSSTRPCRTPATARSGRSGARSLLILALGGPTGCSLTTSAVHLSFI